MLTGASPSSDRAEMLRALLAQVPESVAAVVLRAMEGSVALRYPGVAELRHDTERAAVAGDARPPLRRDAPSWAQVASTVSTWDDPPPPLRRRWYAEGAMLEFGELAWSRDGRWLAINTVDAVRLVELDTRNEVSVPCEATSLSADRHGFLIGSHAGQGIMHVDPDAAAAGRALSRHHRSRFDLISCSPDGSRVAITDDRKLRILDRATWETATDLEFSERLSGLDWSPHGDLLAIGLRGEMAAVLDLQAWELSYLPVGGQGDSARVINLLQHTDLVRRIARRSPLFGRTHVSWSPDGAVLAITTDRTELWAAPDWSRIATLDTVLATRVSLAASSPLLAAFLVGSRIDRGATTASERQVGEIAARHGFARCFETSAKRGDGIERLAAAIHEAIAWERLP
jgi:hypothetical protein